MPNVNMMVQNTVGKMELNGKLWSKVPASNSLLGTSAGKSLLDTAPPEKYEDFAKKFTGERQALRNKVRDYDDDRRSFQSDFKDRMASLRKAGSEIKTLGPGRNVTEPSSGEVSRNENRHSGVSRSDETTGYLRDKETSRTTDSRNEDDRISDSNVKENMDAIRGFVREYNSTVSYLNEGREVSGRLSALASSFSDSGRLSGSLDSIGISRKPDGQLSLDSSKLAESLTERPSKVSEALGSDGLAGQVERKVEIASGQTDKLFTSPADALGGGAASSVKSMYGRDSSVAANAYSDVGGIYQNFG